MNRQSIGCTGVVVMSLLGLTACGTTSSAPKEIVGNATGQAAASVAAGSNSNVSVVIGKAVDTIGFSVVDVALAEHFFEQQGVSVHEELLGGSSQANAALVGGSLQFVCESSLAMALAKQKGIPLLAVDSLDYGVPMQLVASQQWIASHHITATQPLQQRIQALKGMIFGTVSNTDIGYMRLLAKQAGLSDHDFKTEHLQSEAEKAAALSNDRIDAFMGSPPSSLLVLEQGKAQVIVNGKEIPEWRDSTYDILVTT
ncbi:MAG: ABC transporter substrate-binding protein [Alicyclobacillus sp.]|nr:ABC transporter substrate-binding protein [Alicyclobacillus sp.]